MCKVSYKACLHYTSTNIPGVPLLIEPYLIILLALISLKIFKVNAAKNEFELFKMSFEFRVIIYTSTNILTEGKFYKLYQQILERHSLIFKIAENLNLKPTTSP